MEFDSPSGRLSVSGELTIYQAAGFHGELVSALENGLREIDLSGVTELDSAGLQLLVALRCADDGISVAGMTPVIEDALRVAGLVGPSGGCVAIGDAEVPA